MKSRHAPLIAGNELEDLNVVLEPVEPVTNVNAPSTIMEGIESAVEQLINEPISKLHHHSHKSQSVKYHEPIRIRTTSNPSMMVHRQSTISKSGFEKRRNYSLHPSHPHTNVHVHNFNVHSPEWLKKAHAFISGQEYNSDPEEYSSENNGSENHGSEMIPKCSKPNRVPKRKLSRVSSRLTSHHSSSSEEWYSELPDVQEGMTMVTGDNYSNSGNSDPIGTIGSDPDQKNQISISADSTAIKPSSSREEIKGSGKVNRGRGRASIGSSNGTSSCLKCTIM